MRITRGPEGEDRRPGQLDRPHQRSVGHGQVHEGVAGHDQRQPGGQQRQQGDRAEHGHDAVPASRSSTNAPPAGERAHRTDRVTARVDPARHRPGQDRGPDRRDRVPTTRTTPTTKASTSSVAHRRPRLPVAPATGADRSGSGHRGGGRVPAAQVAQAGVVGEHLDDRARPGPAGAGCAPRRAARSTARGSRPGPPGQPGRCGRSGGDRPCGPRAGRSG